MSKLYEAFVLIKGFSVVRMGNVEVTALLQDEGIYEQMYTNAGFVGDEKEFKKWKNDYVRALYRCDTILDVYSCPSFIICGDLLTKLNLWKPTLPYCEEVEPWLQLIQTIQMNTNKPIVVVNYFADEMKKQCKKLKKIHPDFDIKDNFIFIKTKNTIRGNEDGTYSKNLAELLERCKAVDAQHYFVGCGCYGLPLCDALKSNGRNAFYVGGLIQLLFGLRGKRWDSRKVIKDRINDAWIYPKRKPNNAEGVEGWCYGE